MQIQNSKAGDINEIFRLYDIASAYQQSKGVVVWPSFERSLVETELAENRQWKLMMGDAIACVWATTFSDAEIWEKRNKDAAVYIHRIATNPESIKHQRPETLKNGFITTAVNYRVLVKASYMLHIDLMMMIVLLLNKPSQFMDLWH